MGGFTSAQWTNPDHNTRVSDKEAMLFNLTTRSVFKCVFPSSAITCGSNRGPYFGNSELAVEDEPFNTINNCVSKIGEHIFEIGNDSNNNNMLTNLKSQDRICQFSICEMEVWEIIFME